jgi:hypothetical protein
MLLCQLKNPKAETVLAVPHNYLLYGYCGTNFKILDMRENQCLNLETQIMVYSTLSERLT